jgi:acyl-CoA synthetase (AMP-forming)/AMP-acid ligase II/acyl carrier protein
MIGRTTRPDPMSDCSTLIDVVRRKASCHPERRAYTFLKDGESDGEHLTCAELDQRARAIATRLQEIDARGERILLLYPPGLDFIAAFLGCLYAGAVAVPAYPPRANRDDPRIRSIAKDSGASIALTSQSFLSTLGRRGSRIEFAHTQWLASDEIQTDRSEDWRDPGAKLEDLAFLQYTSGSTSAPKGVMVTHGNVMSNARVLREVFDNDETCTMVGWLPSYHDMGLIGNLLQPLYVGALSVFMAPVSFLQHPFRWLRAISVFRAHAGCAPNFAYDLCTSRVSQDQLEQLDLSSWKIAINGAEPVRLDTMERFAAMFGRCGFRREAFYPCYGLAEATLFVTGLREGDSYSSRTVGRAEFEARTVVPGTDSASFSLVGCGAPSSDHRVVIVDPDRLTQCSPERVGEIWISGPSVARGYWGRPEETGRTFGAFVSDTGEGPFFRTGDLGFLDGTELFVAGRIKDLIIIRGRNLYPQDIELTVQQAYPSLRAGCGAAFSIEIETEERLAIVQEIERGVDVEKLPDVLAAIRSAVGLDHEVFPHVIVLVKQGSILKTSSGKIQRRATKAAYLDNSLHVVGEWRNPTQEEPRPENDGAQPAVAAAPARLAKGDIRTLLRAKLAARLGLRPEKVDPRASFHTHGLDSMQAADLIGEVSNALQMQLSPILFWNYPTIDELSEYLAGEMVPAEPGHGH